MDADVREHDAPALVHRRMKAVRGLENAERGGQVEARNATQLRSTIRLDTARQIARDLHDRGVAKSRKVLYYRRFQAPFETRPKQRVNDHRSRLDFRGKLFDLAFPLPA